MVRTDPVRAVELQARRLVTGDVKAARRARVAAEEPGRVLSVEVDEGAHVDAGAVLARLDGTRLALDLDVLAAEQVVARALVDERQADLEQTARDLASVVDLLERHAATQKEVDDARTKQAAANARLAQARSQIAVIDARLAQLRDRLADLEVRAPFAGVVAAVATEAGEWLVAGAAVVDLVSDETEAWLSVPQRQLDALRAKAGPIALKLGDGDAPELEVADWRLVPIVDPELRMLTVIAPLPAGAGAPGLSVQAWVPTAARASYLTVSAAALLRNEIGPYLYVAMPGGEGEPQTALPFQVEVLWREGARAVVAVGGPLQAGAAAIVEGNQRLYPTAAVVPVNASTAEGGAKQG
jgi:RND family efflux transporter MFP subunit